MADLTSSSRKAVIEAVTEAYNGWVDAWENATPMEQLIAKRAFIAGVRWAEEQKR